MSRRFAGGGLIVAHAGRQIRFGPVAFWIAVGSVVVLAGWSVVTATYFAFRDDVLKSFIARQAEQQYAYEDRIAELRARIERATSRELLDQEQFEQKLDDLMRRQSVLETRAAALLGVADPAATGSIRPVARGGQEPPANAAQARDRRSLLEPEWARASHNARSDADIRLKLSRIATALDRVERRQSLALAQIQERYEGKARKMSGVLADLGIKIDTAVRAASGGPFVPVRLPGESNGFERTLLRVSFARTEAEQLSRTLAWIPLRKPVTGEIDISSSFGVRMDPFVRIPAMHTGLDFRGEVGDPVRATATGVVTAAGWSGGYGKMVELEHGHGLSTRYGHLANIDVAIGEKVRIGQIVGWMGSTGRSTGPHLHYETRIDGEAVDPQKFLNAGARLGLNSD